MVSRLFASPCHLTLLDKIFSLANRSLFFDHPQKMHRDRSMRHYFFGHASEYPGNLPPSVCSHSNQVTSVVLRIRDNLLSRSIKTFHVHITDVQTADLQSFARFNESFFSLYLLLRREFFRAAEATFRRGNGPQKASYGNKDHLCLQAFCQLFNLR